MEDRAYQLNAVQSALRAIDAGKNTIVCLPTGSGKSYIIPPLVEACENRTLVISHRKELLEQDERALRTLAPEIDTGIYSAGLNRRDTYQRVIFAGVQSIYTRIDELQQHGAFGLIIIDEAHLVSRKTESMYGRILAQLPGVPLVGLTATPYRMDSGQLHVGDDALFNDMCVHITAKELTPQYLSPLVGLETQQGIDVSSVHMRGGDFIQSELDQVASDADNVAGACKEMLGFAGKRKSWIVFACGVQHAQMVNRQLQRDGVRSVLVTGQTPANERATALDQLRTGETQALVNVEVATTGFDVPRIDAVVSLRPTMSKGLWVQQCGRGTRKAEGKENCLLLDFAGNIPRHGDLDILAEYQQLPETIREQRERAEGIQQRDKAIAKHTQRAYRYGIGESVDIDVERVRYYTQPARRYMGRTNLVAQYSLANGGSVRQWICVEYGNGARWHAEQWFARRGILNVPTDAKDALQIARQLPIPESVSLFRAGKYWNIAIEHWGEIGQEEEID